MLSLTDADCAVSSFGRMALGVGGSVLLMKGCVGLVEGDRVMTVFRGVGRLGLRTGRVGVVALVWIFKGEGGGACRGIGITKGSVAE